MFSWRHVPVSVYLLTLYQKIKTRSPAVPTKTYIPELFNFYYRCILRLNVLYFYLDSHVNQLRRDLYLHACVGTCSMHTISNDIGKESVSSIQQKHLYDIFAYLNALLSPCIITIIIIIIIILPSGHKYRGKRQRLPMLVIQSVGPGADPGVQAVSPQVTISHPPSGRLSLLSARHAVTFNRVTWSVAVGGIGLYGEARSRISYVHYLTCAMYKHVNRPKLQIGKQIKVLVNINVWLGSMSTYEIRFIVTRLCNKPFLHETVQN